MANYIVSSGVTSTGVVLSGYYDTMQVLNGGEANSTIFKNGGYMHVSSGGVANSTNVSAGYMFISSGGVANRTAVNQYGSMYIASGGIATNVLWTPCMGQITVYDGAIVTYASTYTGVYYGSNNQLLSHADVMTGKVVSNEKMYVFSGGVANDTTVNSNGNLHISSGGVANSTTINSAGSMSIFSGGVANSTTVETRGYMHVSSGGVANRTSINSAGCMNISSGGVANSTTLNSAGRMGIASGGTAKNTIIESGMCNIGGASGAILESTHISSGAALTISGNASYSVISGGGTLSATTDTLGTQNTWLDHTSVYGNFVLLDGTKNSNGAAAEHTEVYGGGKMTVLDNCSAVHTDVYSGGSMAVERNAVASNTTADGGVVRIAAGASATQTTVRNRGIIKLSGEALDTTVAADGAFFVLGGAEAQNVTVTGGKVFVATGGEVKGDVSVSSGGGLYLYGGSILNGDIHVQGTLYVDETMVSGGKITVDLNPASASTAMIQNLDLMANVNNFSVETSDTECGTYTLASGAADFDGSITVENDDSTLGTLAVGESKTLSGKGYTLAKNADELTLTISDAPITPAVSDYNKSGKSDMIQFVDGKVYVTHDTKSGYEQTPAINDVTGWNVTEIRRDLTGDGYADVQITAYDGASQTWVATLRNDYLSTGCITLNYQFIGAYETKLWSYLGSADFNGDGKSEILMIQTEAGKDQYGHRNVAGWITDTTTCEWVDNIWLGALDDNWDVAGTADVTGDGADNVLLRRSDGMIGYWDQAGTNNIVELKNAGNRVLLTTGDFDGDGAADFLWQAIGGSEFSVWSDLGGAFTDTAIGKVSDLGGNWTFAGVGDYNGDGKDEILWCDTTTYTTAYGEGNKANFAKLTVIA